MGRLSLDLGELPYFSVYPLLSVSLVVQLSTSSPIPSQTPNINWTRLRCPQVSGKRWPPGFCFLVPQLSQSEPTQNTKQKPIFG